MERGREREAGGRVRNAECKSCSSTVYISALFPAGRNPQNNKVFIIIITYYFHPLYLETVGVYKHTTTREGHGCSVNRHM